MKKRTKATLHFAVTLAHAFVLTSSWGLCQLTE